MNHDRRHVRLWLCCVGLSLGSFASFDADAAARLPNFVVILCDNLGYGDVGCFGSTLHRTPHIDRMSREGMRLTSFYSTSGVCTPSRASLLTGCYPRRVGLDLTEPDGAVLRPVSPNGLHRDEITLAELLRDCGYATACIGKWHLGDQLEFLPTQQGFDEYLGIPYSDDMTARPDRDWPPLPLLENERVVAAPVDRNRLTQDYTERAVKFITQHRDHPFFLYLPHAMPGSTHAPFASEAFRGQSNNGPYGDAVEELDWSTGQIMATLKQLGIDEDTLVIWTSDNGAPRRDPPQGRNLPLSGWGYTTMEGGMRVPCVAQWNGRIPANSRCDQLCTMMDLLPTFVSLAGGKLPDDRVIDGHDIWPLLSTRRNDVASPYNVFYYYYRDQLQAVRTERWKLHLALPDKQTTLRGKTERSAHALYDLVNDAGEQHNLAATHPDVVRQLTSLADAARTDLGEGNRAGAHQRPVGRVARPVKLEKQ